MTASSALTLARLWFPTARAADPFVSEVDGERCANIIVARPSRADRTAFVGGVPGATFSITTSSCTLHIPV